MNELHLADSFSIVSQLPDESIDLIYTDPPFGTSTTQAAQRGQLPKMAYSDRQDDYLSFLVPYLSHFFRVLKTTGTLYLHLDPRWSHYVKVAADGIFGRDNFLNEIIWAYDYGGRGRTKWPAKHDVILVYTKCAGRHVFNWDVIDRIPYMAPGLQKDPVRAAAGKVPTDVWWMSIVGTASKERVGYPNQKPLKLVQRCIVASSPEGGRILDPFAGSGTTGVAATNLGRSYILIDRNPQAIQVTRQRLDAIGSNYTLCT